MWTPLPKWSPLLILDSKMIIRSNEYFHLYNRSNNNEIVYKSVENYHYFLRKCRKYLNGLADVIGYCLMPTHFHGFNWTPSQRLSPIITVLSPSL